MTGDELVRSYVDKATLRLDVLALLFEREGYSDVVREAQEIVELLLKAALRLMGIDPPRIHDVGPVLLTHRTTFPTWFADGADRLAEISAWLRKERELALYGDTDAIPTKLYGVEHATRAIDDARTVFDAVSRLLAERAS